MANKEVHIYTTITTIGIDGTYKPKSPFFTFYNDGDSYASINGYLILPFQSFGISADALVAHFLDKGVEVVNDTQYTLLFMGNPAWLKSVKLIETFVKFV